MNLIFRYFFFLASFFFLAFLITACSPQDERFPIKSEINTPKPPSPHPGGFELKKGHGLYLLKSNLGTNRAMRESCGGSSCHGENLRGATAPTSCFDCHNYPHPDRLRDAIYHREKKYTPETGKQCEEACHKPNAENDYLETACESCHTLYQHPTRYSGPFKYKYWPQHGLEALISNAQTCRTRCHGPDLRGGTTKQDCYGECHQTLHLNKIDYKDTPHMEDSRKFPADCSICHNDSADRIVNLPGNSIKVTACFTCHVSYPHHYASKSDHIAEIMANPMVDQTCQTASACHLSELKGETYNYPLACTTYCHTDSRPGSSMVIP